MAFEHMLTWMNITWEEIDAWDVNNRNLTQLYRAFWMPGGWAANYINDIDSSGVNNIRQLVSSGRGYIGTCAGAYYAADHVIWEGVRYDYPLKLFNGHADGSIHVMAPWPKYNMTMLNMNMSHPINTSGNATELMLYYGGPEFYPVPNQNANYSVIATWNETGNAAIISFTYGLGRVLLIGPHPEIEEDSIRDGSSFADQFDDQGSDWPFMKCAMKWVLDLNETDTLTGDLNKDGIVDILDIAIIAKAFWAHEEDERWNSDADLNGDAVVNIIDISLAAKEFGKC